MAENITQKPLGLVFPEMGGVTEGELREAFNQAMDNADNDELPYSDRVQAAKEALRNHLELSHREGFWYGD